MRCIIKGYHLCHFEVNRRGQNAQENCSPVNIQSIKVKLINVYKYVIFKHLFYELVDFET